MGTKEYYYAEAVACKKAGKVKEAFDLFLKAAELGHADAQNQVGEMYLNGLGCKQNYQEANRWFNKAEEQDHIPAFMNSGVCYENGWGVGPDRQMAWWCYDRAVRLGNLHAQKNCRRLEQEMYEAHDAKSLWWTAYDCELLGNHKKAMALYARSAKLGYAEAYYNLGKYYEEGEIVPQDEDKALELYKEAANRGDWQGRDAYERLSMRNSGGYDPYLNNNNGYDWLNLNTEVFTDLWSDLDDDDGFASPCVLDDFDWDESEDEETWTDEEDATESESEMSSSYQVTAGAQKSAIDELNALIGLESVKKDVRELTKLIRVQKAHNLKMPTTSRHMVFTGNPGTGKTTVARLIARIYYELGLLEKADVVEVERADLVGEFIGHTAQKTKAIIEEAMGGVLFIDEAYTLVKKDSPRDFGQEAIDTLIKAMEDHRDRFIVIVAGYSDEMHDFINSNAGLKSRFNKYIHFDDYTADELIQIFYQMASANAYTVEDEAQSLLKQHFDRVLRRSRGKKFGNAREVRNFFDVVVTQHATGLPEDVHLTKEQIRLLTRRDIQAAEEAEGEHTPVKEETANDRLNKLIGLESVKQKVAELRALAIYQKMRRDANLGARDVAMHMVFTGNPGTGKTTVARLIGEIYHEIGLLPTPHMEEVSRADLVGQHIGETAIRTQDRIERALGGILFIDEAYTLTKADDSKDFGQEAVDTLLKAMEDHRENLMVIVAGYTDRMDEFISSNPGLKSRFTECIHFDDYTGDQLEQIFCNYASAEQNTLTEDAQEELHRICERMYAERSADFGNAREMRNFYEAVLRNVASRVMKLPVQTNEDLTRITRADILAAAPVDRGELPKKMTPKKIGFI